MQDYHTLRIWKKGQRMSVAVHRLVAGLPRRGYASLKDQLIRSAESIPTNIVEGCGASSAQDFGRYLDYSIKSLCELEHHVESTRDLKLITARECDRYTNEIVVIRKMTVNFKQCVLNGADDKNVDE